VKWLRRALAALAVIALALLAGVVAAGFPPSWGAGAILHPARHAPGPPPPGLGRRDVEVRGDGVTLKGWHFLATGTPRWVTVVYLHGSADNRASGNWIAERLVPAGFDVLAYDGRAHGQSTGDACTYGVLERQDLRRALDQLGVQRAILVGGSLGAAVALQAAAEDPRVIGVVAASTFSDLESIARERAPATMREGQIREALALVEAQGGFRVAEASPLRAAGKIRVPVLVLHGADDAETSVEHSRRVHAALAGPKALRTVEGAGHTGPLSMAWADVERWLDQVAPPKGPRAEAKVPGIWRFEGIVPGEPLSPRLVERFPTGSLSPHAAVEALNRHWPQPGLDLLRQKEEAVFLRVRNAELLTQGMGTTGAMDYMATVVFTLTSLPGVELVHLDFPEGDHAAPGMFGREDFTK
jgi:pimeloyl-ACP methyl ester carboxylesterase